jgi:uncharacterized phage-associated protein
MSNRLLTSAVANELLDMAAVAGRPITQLDLHKLLFFAHGYSLTKFGEPLVDERFVAWKHGPVLRSLYQKFRSAEAQPIKNRVEAFDPNLRKFAPVKLDDVTTQQEPIREALAETMRLYKNMTPPQLVAASHAEGSPWDVVWNHQMGKYERNRIIPDPMIRNYFAAS